MKNILKAVREYLSNVPFVYIKILHTEQFKESQIDEFSKYYHCWEESTDDEGEYIYKFLMKNKANESEKDIDELKPIYNFAIDVEDF